MSIGRTQKLIFSASGIFMCYLCFGILQEHITKSHYKLPDGSYELFVFPTSLVWVFCIINFLFAKLILSIQKQEDTTRKLYYCMDALFYLLAMVCGNMSLQFISYPTHVVGKTIKPIFVMVVGVLLGKKQYSFRKYCFVTLIISGAILFLYKDKGDSSVKKGFSLGFGELLLFLSLVMDGFTAGIQERMIAEYQTKSLSLMLNLNKWAIVYAGSVILFTGEIFKFVEFVKRHPFIIGELLLLSLTSSCGQFFIYTTITEFGPLVCSIVATLRKLFSVLVSVVFLGNALVPRQWLATCIVFTGLFLDSYFGKSPTKSK